MRFYVADTLTGKIVGRLEGRLAPTDWELSDPLREPGVGSLVIPKPETPQELAKLRELKKPKIRWVAAQDESGAWVWGGPIVGEAREDSTTTLKLVDWRSWFFTAPLRPSASAGWDDYIVSGVDQGTIAADLFARALDVTWPDDSHLLPPAMIVDTPPPTGVDRDRTFRMLDRKIGDYLQTLVDTERGIEWHTYVTPKRSDPTVLEVHTSVAYPERSSRSTPIRLEWRLGRGGNTAERPSWPETRAAASRVWAIGDGEPPDQAWAVDEDPDATVVWEDVIGPLDGVRKSATAFEHAYAHLQRSAGFAETAEFVVTTDTIALGEVGTGDRARVIYEDGWAETDLPACRIVSRIMSGGRGKPTQQRLVVDLADAFPGAVIAEPGTDGVPEEG